MAGSGFALAGAYWVLRGVMSTGLSATRYRSQLPSLCLYPATAATVSAWPRFARQGSALVCVSLPTLWLLLSIGIQ